MKNTKAVYVNRDISYFNLQNPINKSLGASDKSSNDFGCQFNSRKDNLICTCRRIKRQETGYFSSRQVYRSQRYFNSDFTDIGGGNVKTLYKKRVKRIYLPETADKGVGSSDLSYLRRRKRWADSYYELKQTSSKCVGAVMEKTKVTVISKKLSPIIKTISGSTSPTVINFKNNDTSSFDKKLTVKPCETNKYLTPGASTEKTETDHKNNTLIPIKNNIKSTIITIDDNNNDSSDSFVQHVHNLDNPNFDKQSTTSVDFVENKLEREYRKMFSTKPNNNTIEKPIIDEKSSLLRRRFKALRCLGKKEDKIDSVVIKIPSKCSFSSKKDVSIASDPPSLESRSYSNTKIYSSNESAAKPLRKETQKKEILSNRPTEIVDSDCQDVKGMFKLWGKKFNFEDDNYKKISPENSTVSKGRKKQVELVLPKEENLDKEKKEGKRFSFFRRKNKDKTKPFKSKKSVIAGRCEVGDGLMIKIGNANEYNQDEAINKIESIPDYDILRKAWLRSYLYNKLDSQNSVQIRWNNSMYTVSSSTGFALLDCVYKNTSIVFESRSQITTKESSYYTYRRPQVNFMQQSIEAWMVPTITRNHSQSKNNNRIEVTVSNQKWFIAKSKAFSKKIELVLQSNTQNREVSSEYIIIDIPNGYFSETSSDEKGDRTSDELVYNIVEYETPNSKTYLPREIKEQKMETGDAKDILVAAINSEENKTKLSGKLIESPLLHRDVLIQGSDVCFPRRCDVIGVGIVTQRDLRDNTQQPMLKLTDESTNNELKLPPLKTCELAESFLQDYYRNCSPLGYYDVLSRCISKSKLRGLSENNSLKNLSHQRDGSKSSSCLSIYEDNVASAIVSSCETSSCSHCIALEQEKIEHTQTTKFVHKFENKKSSEPISQVDVMGRKIYAARNKSKWVNDCDRLLDKCAQKDCDVMDKILREPHSDKSVEGILSLKGAAGCCICRNLPRSQRNSATPDSIYEIPQGSCKDSCFKEQKPAYSKKKSPTSNVPAPPPYPAGPPSTYQKACPPSPPPSRMTCCGKSTCPCLPPSLHKNKPTSCSKSSSPQFDPLCSRLKQMTTKVHSPPVSSRPLSSCICSKKQLIPNTSRCSIPKKTTCPSPPSISPQKTSDGPSYISGCKSPPPKIEKTCCQEFPWPIKCHESCTPPKESGSCLNVSSQQNLKKKTSNKCVNAIKRLIQKLSSPSLKDCKPDCANRSKVIPSTPYPPNTAISNTSAKKTKCSPKMTGLHLKKPPMPKPSSKDCMSTCDEGIIRLNSRENMTIKLRQNTPSTEEIRESCNIKVKDEDGQTLYERRDYKKIDKNRMQFVKDMYRDSQIQRLPTANPDTDPQENELKVSASSSDSSLSNILEINFNLKLKKTDKTTEVSIKNCGDTYKEDNRTRKKEQECCHKESTKEIYVLNDQANAKEEVNNFDTKDVNINITIRNYEKPNKKTNKNIKTDDFSKKISEKFLTVSTDYSDVIDPPTYSVHRTTVNVSDSDIHKGSSKSSVELLNEELKDLEPIKFTDSDVTVNQPASNKTSSTIENLVMMETESEIKLSKDIIYTTNDEKSGTSISVTNKSVNSEIKDGSNDTMEIIPKIRTKEEKKRILEEIFETASKDRQKNKKQIHQMLRAVLSSNSSDDDIEVNSELVKELTYESLKPNFYKNSDSVANNLHGTCSVQSINKDFKQAINPTEENNSECSDSDQNENVGCICSKLAEKLKITQNSAGGCRCRCISKRDEEITCDLQTRYVIETKHTDVESQSSKDISKKASYIPKYEEMEKKETKSKQFTSNLKVKACQIKKLDKRTILEVSDEDKVVLLSTRECSKSRKTEPLDVLQLYETKRAVLEIYADKTFSEDGEKLVAKLPKFVYEHESEIRNCHDTAAGFHGAYNEE